MNHEWLSKLELWLNLLNAYCTKARKRAVCAYMESHLIWAGLSDSCAITSPFIGLCSKIWLLLKFVFISWGQGGIPMIPVAPSEFNCWHFTEIWELDCSCMKDVKECFSNPTRVLSKPAKECLPCRELWKRSRWGTLVNGSVIPSVFCQQCVIFCPQVFAAGERHPGRAQRNHRHTLQPPVWKDGGGEPGQRQQRTVQHSGMRGHGRGRAGLHALLYQR